MKITMQNKSYYMRIVEHKLLEKIKNIKCVFSCI